MSGLLRQEQGDINGKLLELQIHVQQGRRVAVVSAVSAAAAGCPVALVRGVEGGPELHDPCETVEGAAGCEAC